MYKLILSSLLLFSLSTTAGVMNIDTISIEDPREIENSYILQLKLDKSLLNSSEQNSYGVSYSLFAIYKRLGLSTEECKGITKAFSLVYNKRVSNIDKSRIITGNEDTVGLQKFYSTKNCKYKLFYLAIDFGELSAKIDARDRKPITFNFNKLVDKSQFDLLISGSKGKMWINEKQNKDLSFDKYNEAIINLTLDDYEK